MSGSLPPDLLRALLQMRDETMQPFVAHLASEIQARQDRIVGASEPIEIYRLQGQVQALRQVQKLIADAPALAKTGR